MVSHSICCVGFVREHVANIVLLHCSLLRNAFPLVQGPPGYWRTFTGSTSTPLLVITQRSASPASIQVTATSTTRSAYEDFLVDLISSRRKSTMSSKSFCCQVGLGSIGTHFALPWLDLQIIMVLDS